MWKNMLCFAVMIFFTARVLAGNEAVIAYAKAIQQAQADMDAGKVAEASKALDSTEKSLRGWEFDYLRARSLAPFANGGPVDLIKTIERPTEESRYGVLNPIERQMVYICRDGALRIHDLNELAAPPKPVAYAKGGAMWSGAFSGDGKTFVTGHANGEVVVWDAKTWTVRHAVQVGSEAVRELAIAPDGMSFLAEGAKHVELWSLAEKEPKKVADVGERYNFGEGVAFSSVGNLIATGGMFDIILHDAKTGVKGNSFRHASYTMGLEFSPDGKRIASAPRGNVNKFLGVFDVATGKQHWNAGPFGDYVAGLAFTPNGKRIVATGCGKSVRLFDAETGEVMLKLPRVECSAKPGISRDGKIIGWSEPGGYRLIDLGKK